MKKFKNLDYILKSHEVSYHYSSSLFAKARRNKISKDLSGIYAFAPVYDQTPKSADKTSAETKSELRAMGNDGNFSPLPESEKEATASPHSLFLVGYSIFKKG